MRKTNALIVGATGSTGLSIADALLASSDFHVIAYVRPSSLQKPAIDSLVSQGAEIRPLDLSTSSPKQLIEPLKGVDIVVSTIELDKLKLQYPVIDAARKAGVKSFVPSDWSPVCYKGVRQMHDEKKLAIHEYIMKSDLAYTFTDAGYWFSLPPTDTLPPTQPSAYDWPLQTFGAGDVKCAMIHLMDIGPFVAHILLDERTLGKCVFLYAGEFTQDEVFTLARRISGDRIADPSRISEEEVRELVEKTDPRSVGGRDEGESGWEFQFAMWEYALSIWFRGDNTMEYAGKMEYGGAVDGKELYPDVKLKSLEEYAREVYGVASA